MEFELSPLDFNLDDNQTGDLPKVEASNKSCSLTLSAVPVVSISRFMFDTIIS
jgi:hypothetical protein